MTITNVPVSNPPDAYMQVLLPLVATARSIVERGESLVPMAFVGNFSTGKTQFVALDVSTENSKAASLTAIRLAAESMKADFVFMIVEAWSLPPDKVHQTEKIMEKYGSIGQSPYRIDIVSMTLETRYGMWAAQCNIKPKGVSKKKRTFADPEFRLFKEMQGRFTHLLADTSEPEATLH